MSPIKLPTWTLSRIVSFSLVFLLVVGALVYTLFQGRFLILGPQISLDGIPATVQAERVVTLAGTAKNITALYLNGLPIVTNESGQFQANVVLENGYTIVRLEAVDRYGRRTYVEQDFVYQPS